MLHHLTAILILFFARQTTLADRKRERERERESDVNNITISFSLFLLSLFSDRSSPLLHDTAFPSSSGKIAGHSIYISVLFADKRVSMATISSGRMEPIVFLLAPPISRLVPLLLFFLPSPSHLLQLFSSSPFLVAIVFVSPTWSRRLVGRNYDVAWRRVRTATRPVAFTIARCTHRPTLVATGHLHVLARKRKFRCGDCRDESVVREDHFWYRFILKANLANEFTSRLFVLDPLQLIVQRERR